jgi:hypothetical protein
MTFDEITSLLKTAPVTIRLTSGENVHLPHEDFVTVSHDGSSLALFDKADRFWLIDTAHIAAITRDKRKRAA